MISDLREAIAIAEERTQNAISDREKFQNKNREYIHKMETMNDQLEDKNLLIQEHEAKISLLKDENKILKESQENMNKRLEDIYENHILIAKYDHQRNTNLQEEEEQKAEYKAMNNIQDEVRKLHIQLQQKDAVINQLKQLA